MDNKVVIAVIFVCFDDHAFDGGLEIYERTQVGGNVKLGLF